MIDYTLLSEDELRTLSDANTTLWICRAEANDRLYDDLLRGLACEDELSYKIAEVNQELYRRRQ